MPRYREIPLSTVGIGMTVDFKLDQGFGRGGEVTAITETHVSGLGGSGRVPFTLALDEIRSVWVEHPFPLTDCVRYDPDVCSGTVDYFSPRGMGGPPHCEAHVEERLDEYEESLERYADCSIPPAWLDPADAGESWEAP